MKNLQDLLDMAGKVFNESFFIDHSISGSNKGNLKHHISLANDHRLISNTTEFKSYDDAHMEILKIIQDIRDKDKV